MVSGAFEPQWWKWRAEGAVPATALLVTHLPAERQAAPASPGLAQPRRGGAGRWTPALLHCFKARCRPRHETRAMPALRRSSGRRCARSWALSVQAPPCMGQHRAHAGRGLN